eukprot:TRINITY_DN124_c5_g1_i2.p1 TRINITY_DN124_c5_g1~~TRINITY_DN124_c5_g1_i2.p1  ORF type:complete len:1071 (+),score=346.11 TRINITY_DN124_c5_g1_i2:76-3288(+)
MPKDRFTTLDVRREIQDLKSQILGLRLANFYDVDKKTYLLKFAKTDSKVYVIIESGIRIHSTQYTHEKGDIPNIFSVKIRKYIRTKRLEDVKQYGMDRVVDFTFGTGEASYHLIVELYSGGNIILTDNTFKILLLLRTVQQEGFNISLGAIYPTNDAQQVQHLTEEKVATLFSGENLTKTVKHVIAESIPYGNPLVEHCLINGGFKPEMKVKDFDNSLIPKLVESFLPAVDLVESPTPSKGWIVCTKRKQKNQQQQQQQKQQKASQDVKSEDPNPEASPNPEDDLLYDQFVPFLYQQYQNSILKEYSSFDAAVDEYFSKIYSQKVEIEKEKQETLVDKKLEKVKQDQFKRVKGLEDEVSKLERSAKLIEENIDSIDQCINALRASLANHIAWEQLKEFIKEERSQGNPLALMIHKLKLEANQVSILLYDQFVDEEEQTMPAEVVDIDISLTAHANAREYFAKRKRAEEKKDKTMIAADQALKSAERAAKQKLKEVKMKQSVKQIRKPYWFEKFNWFITSDNYIVVGGRDIQQNETIYKRYLEKTDIYFHADLHGASSVIVKNPTGEPLPPLTITQAGVFAMSHSNAWKNKVITSAYWVNENQVSKTAPTGEYLTPGSFMIRGKKNLLPHNPLVMGLALLFKLGDESVKNHEDERKPKFFDERDTEDTNNEPKKWEPKHKDKKWKQASEDQEDEEVEEEEPKQDEEVIEGTVKEENNEDNETKDTEEIENQETEKKDGDDDSESLDESLLSDLGSSGSIKLVNETNSGRNSLAASKTTKKKMSARERKMLKKAAQKKNEQIEEDDEEEKNENEPTIEGEGDGEGEGEGEEEEGEEEEEEKQDNESNESDNKQSAHQKVKGPKPIEYKKGQKAKMKKIKAKYGWQDEEDRKIHMEMLGHGEKEGKNKKVAESIERREEFKQKTEKKKQILNAKTQRDKEEEEIRQLLREEKIDGLNEEDKKKLDDMTAKGLGVNLTALTGKPLENDVLQYAIPVCAPYDSVKDYKFKVKVTPGSDKKGKAIKLIMELFLRTPGITDREKELIKSITDNEWGYSLISNSKVSAPGVQAVKRKK